MDRFATEWAEERERQFRRFLWISAAVHVVAIVLVWVAPVPSTSQRSLPAVVRVDLVTMAPAARAKPKPAPARPKPAPARPKPVEPPKPKPKAPKPPTPEKVVLPTEPTTPKPKPVEKVAEPEPTKEPEPAESLSYEDAMSQLRGEDADQQYDDALDRLRAEASAASAARAGPAGGPGVVVSPEEFAWRKRAKLHVTQAWVLDVGFRSQELVTEVEVNLAPDGTVRSVSFARRSGNPWYDEGVERAVQKASPLPPPPESGNWAFRFSPRDAR